MKKTNWMIIACVCLLCIAIGSAVCAEVQKIQMEDRLYPNVAVVVEIDRTADTLTVEDSIGHLWVVEGVEDYMEGDLVGMVMDSMGTDLVFDDAVVKMHYCGGWVD